MPNNYKCQDNWNKIHSLCLSVVIVYLCLVIIIICVGLDHVLQAHNFEIDDMSSKASAYSQQIYNEDEQEILESKLFA